MKGRNIRIGYCVRVLLQHILMRVMSNMKFFLDEIELLLNWCLSLGLERLQSLLYLRFEIDPSNQY